MNAGKLLKSAEFPPGSIYLKDINANENIGEAYKLFFESETGWRIYQNRQQLKDLPNFELDTPEAEEALDALGAACRSNARFTRKEYTDLVYSSVSLRLNFLVRPVNTLKFFLFGYAPTKPLEELLLKLDYFYDYGYLTVAMQEEIIRKQAESSVSILSLPEFNMMLEKIDSDYFQNLTVEEFATLLSPCFEFFDLKSKDTQEPVIPVEALIVFLNDKGISTMARLIKDHANGPSKNYLTKNSIIDIFDSVMGNIGQDMTAPAEMFREEETPEEDNGTEAADETGSAAESDEFPEETPAAEEEPSGTVPGEEVEPEDFIWPENESGFEIETEEISHEEMIEPCEADETAPVTEQTEEAWEVTAEDAEPGDAEIDAPADEDSIEMNLAEICSLLGLSEDEAAGSLELSEPAFNFDEMPESFSSEIEEELFALNRELAAFNEFPEAAEDAHVENSAGDWEEGRGGTFHEDIISNSDSADIKEFDPMDEVGQSTAAQADETEDYGTLEEIDSIGGGLPEYEEFDLPFDDSPAIDAENAAEEFDSGAQAAAENAAEEEDADCDVRDEEEDAGPGFSYDEYLEAARNFEYQQEQGEPGDAEDIIELYSPVIEAKSGEGSEFISHGKAELCKELENFFEDIKEKGE